MPQADVFELVSAPTSARGACDLLSELLDVFECFGVHLCQRRLMPSPRARELAEFLTSKHVGSGSSGSARLGNPDDPLLHRRVQMKARSHGSDGGEIVRMAEPAKYQVRLDSGFAPPSPPTTHPCLLVWVPPRVGGCRQEFHASHARRTLQYGVADKDFELVEWVGKKRTLYDRGEAITCQELRFSTARPFGVVDPPAAASALSDSLCCVRSAIRSEELRELQAQLVAATVRAPWGDPTDLEMSKSQRSLLYIHPEAAALASKGANGVPATALNSRNACVQGDLAGITELLGIQDEPLMGLQANYQHTNFPLHYDIPREDGFGKSIATVHFSMPACSAMPNTYYTHTHARTCIHKRTEFAQSLHFPG
jgi:hypothetical protein